LKKSGLNNVFFVIETAGKDRSKDVRQFEDAVNTAISSTQVVDEFFVHQTTDAKGTVELLKILHDAVCDKYRVRTKPRND
jgi:crossover junction endonuclease MUS81